MVNESCDPAEARHRPDHHSPPAQQAARRYIRYIRYVRYICYTRYIRYILAPQAAGRLAQRRVAMAFEQWHSTSGSITSFIARRMKLAIGSYETRLVPRAVASSPRNQRRDACSLVHLHASPVCFLVHLHASPACSLACSQPHTATLGSERTQLTG